MYAVKKHINTLQAINSDRMRLILTCPFLYPPKFEFPEYLLTGVLDATWSPKFGNVLLPKLPLLVAWLLLGRKGFAPGLYF